MTVRHAAEHGIYVLEADGYLLDRFKAFYNEEYGVLTFVEDHGVMQNCEAAGQRRLRRSIPAPRAETGDQRASREPSSATARRSASATCTTTPPATRAPTATPSTCTTTTSTTTRSASRPTSSPPPATPASPRTPTWSSTTTSTRTTSTPTRRAPTSIPTFPVPVGTGLWIAGGNDNIVRNNRFWDNWRRGTMLFAVPDATVCNDPSIQVPGCSAGRDLDLLQQQLPRQRDGRGAERAAVAQRGRLLVGPLPRQHRQLLVLEHRRFGQVDNDLAAAAGTSRTATTARAPA